MRTSARLVAALLFLLAPAVLVAQRVPAPADLAPIVETETITPGSEVHVALQVTLPEGFHMNSNKPRDPLLIPVVLSIPGPKQEPLPAGVSVTELVFPEARDLKQRDTVLSVFEQGFVIGAVLKVDSSVAPGKLVVPGTLRYQACDDPRRPQGRR